MCGNAGKRGKTREGRARAGEGEPEQTEKRKTNHVFLLFFPAGGRRLSVIAIGQPLKSLREGGAEGDERRVRRWLEDILSAAHPVPSVPHSFCPTLSGQKNAPLGMCYLDVAADPERLLLRREERVGHLLRGGLNLLLYLLLGDTLLIATGAHTKGRTPKDGHRHRHRAWGVMA